MRHLFLATSSTHCQGARWLRPRRASATSRPREVNLRLVRPWKPQYSYNALLYTGRQNKIYFVVRVVWVGLFPNSLPCYRSPRCSEHVWVCTRPGDVLHCRTRQSAPMYIFSVRSPSLSIIIIPFCRYCNPRCLNKSNLEIPAVPNVSTLYRIPLHWHSFYPLCSVTG